MSLGQKYVKFVSCLKVHTKETKSTEKTLAIKLFLVPIKKSDSLKMIFYHVVCHHLLGAHKTVQQLLPQNTNTAPKKMCHPAPASIYLEFKAQLTAACATHWLKI